MPKGFSSNILPNSSESGVGQVFSTGAGSGAARFTLSESDTGAPILATNNTGASATLIHECSSTALDELYLWAANYSGDDIVLTMSLDDTGFSTNGKYWKTTLAANGGLYMVFPGIPVTSGVKVFAKATNNTSIVQGFVLRRYPKSSGATSKVKKSGYDGQN
jgi:hypothetical protein